MGYRERLRWYGNYLLTLQEEFREMVEFCYDENFYPELFRSLYPSERLSIYRNVKDLPSTFERKEKLELSKNRMGGDKMPYGITGDELMDMLRHLDLTSNDSAKEFAEKYNYPIIDVPINNLIFEK